MLKIAVLDDQKFYIEMVERITRDSLGEQGINYEFFAYISPEDLLQDIEEDNRYDIYLLDVEMPGLSGLEVARKIRELYYDSVIIYITNFVEYAVEGYETNAYRYIPKKMLKEKLPEAYASIYPKIKNKKKNFYIIEKNHTLERIPYEDIYYVKKEEKYLLIVHKRGTSRERKTISEFLEDVKQYDSAFIGVDRSYIVNAIHIMNLKNQQILLKNGDIIPVSRLKLSHVKKEIMRIWQD